jgi:hypothetical protein
MKTILKTSVAAAALMAIAAPVSAQNLSRETGRDKVNLKIYGHVNKAVLWGDDGNNDRTFIVDNNVSATRLGFIATAPVNADLTFGAQLEVAIRSNISSTDAAPQAAATGVQINSGTTATTGIGTANDTAGGETSFSERIAEVTATHKRFGKLSLGQGSTATDGITEFYLGGAGNVVGVVASTSHLTGTVLYDKANSRYYRNLFKGTTTGVAVTAGSGMSYFDGPRDDRVMYQTPRIMGFRAGTSFSSGGEGQVAVDYNDKIGQFKIQAGVGYANFSSRATTSAEAVNGSIAVLHDSGLNTTIAAGHRIYKKNWCLTGVSAMCASAAETSEMHDTGNATSIGGSVGYIAKIFGVGPTAFGVDYHHFANTRVQGSDTTTWGIGVEQTFADTGASVYLGYRNTSFDLGSREQAIGVATNGGANPSIDDLNIVIAGMRVVF